MPRPYVQAVLQALQEADRAISTDELARRSGYAGASVRTALCLLRKTMTIYSVPGPPSAGGGNIRLHTLSLDESVRMGRVAEDQRAALSTRTSQKRTHNGRRRTLRQLSAAPPNRPYEVAKRAYQNNQSPWRRGTVLRINPNRRLK